MRRGHQFSRVLARALVLSAGLVACESRPQESVPMTVFNAAALGPPFHDLLAAFDSIDGGKSQQESAPSLDVVRKLTELGHVPDVLAVADAALLPALVLPVHAAWYIEFGTNAMVLAYGPRARYAAEITRENWWEILTRPDVEVGRSDLRVDPSGYRADFAMQLAERHYGVPGLAAKLRARIPERNVRRAEADLSALLESSELDYGWTYESLAIAHGLRYLRLPPEVDLSDPALAEFYGQARLTLPGGGNVAPMEVVGAPIVFALTIPAAAARQERAMRFVQFLLSPTGSEILSRSGFQALTPPRMHGTIPEALSSGVSAK